MTNVSRIAVLGPFASLYLPNFSFFWSGILSPYRIEKSSANSGKGASVIVIYDQKVGYTPEPLWSKGTWKKILEALAALCAAGAAAL